MNFTQTFEPLLKTGVEINVRLQEVDGSIQMVIVPKPKENKANIAMPPKVLRGTAEEIDGHLSHVLKTYTDGLTTINDVIELTEKQMKEAVEAAESQAKAARENAAKAKPGVSPKASKLTTVKPNAAASVFEMEDEDADTNAGESQGNPADASATLAKPAVVADGGLSSFDFI